MNCAACSPQFDTVGIKISCILEILLPAVSYAVDDFAIGCILMSAASFGYFFLKTTRTWNKMGREDRGHHLAPAKIRPCYLTTHPYHSAVEENNKYLFTWQEHPWFESYWYEQERSDRPSRGLLHRTERRQVHQQEDTHQWVIGSGPETFSVS